MPTQQQMTTLTDSSRLARLNTLATFQENLDKFDKNEQLSEVLEPYRHQVVSAAQQFVRVASQDVNDFLNEQKLKETIALLDQAITLVNTPQIDMKELNKKLQAIEVSARELDDPKKRSYRRLRKCLDVIGFGLLAIGAIGLVAMIYVGTAGAAAIPTAVMLPPIIAFFASLGVGGAFLLPRLCSDSSKTGKFAHSAISHSLFSFRDKIKDATLGIDPSDPWLFSKIHRAMR